MKPDLTLSRRDVMRLSVAGSAGAALTDAVAPSAAAATAHTATVLPETHQLIKGWGCFAARMYYYPNLVPVLPETLADAMFHDLGMNVLRTQIHPGCYDLDKDDGSLRTEFLDRTVTDLVQQAAEYGVDQWIVSVWTPPLTMKNYPTHNGRYTPPGASDWEFTRLRVDAEDDYVRYLCDVLLHLESMGISLPVGISLQNEPLGGHTWHACGYEADQYQRITKMLRQGLDDVGLETVLIMGPEGARMEHCWDRLGGVSLPDLASDAELHDAIGAIAHHSYDQRFDDRHSLWPEYSAAAAATGKDLWMTEWSRGQGSTPIARTVYAARHLARDLVTIRNNYWVWWQGFNISTSNQGQHLIYGTYEEPVYGKEYFLLRALWNSAPAEVSMVKSMTTDDPDLVTADSPRVDLLALESADAMTVLVANPHPEPHPLHLTGLAGKDYTLQRSSDTEDMDQVDAGAVVDGTVTVDVPPESVVLLTTSATVDLARLRRWAARYAADSGSAQALDGPLSAAERAESRGDLRVRDRLLSVFIRQVGAQRRHGLLRGQADLLVRCAEDSMR